MRSPSQRKDRRKAERFSCQGPIDFRIQGWYLRKGQILNVCLDGCLLEPVVSPGCVPGEHLDLRFEVNRTPFRAHCVVRRVQASGAIGVEILHLSKRGRLRLQELIDELGSVSAPVTPSR